MLKKKSIITNLKKNKDYIIYYSKILFKSRVAETKLGILWLLLDPLAFMMVYSFVVQTVFANTMPNFNIYVFIGLTAWKFFSGTVLMGPSAISKNKVIFEQVYFHKFVYPSIYIMENLYEYLIASSLIVVLLLFARVPFSWHIIEFIPVLIVLMMFTYGLTLIASHIGVYFFDLRNVLDIIMRFMFYMSPIMWSYTNIQKSHPEYVFWLKLNPMSIVIQNLRNVFLERISPDYQNLAILAVISLLLIAWGYRMISKHEDEYGRVL